MDQSTRFPERIGDLMTTFTHIFPRMGRVRRTQEINDAWT
jgi:hypothetical protein